MLPNKPVFWQLLQYSTKSLNTPQNYIHQYEVQLKVKVLFTSNHQILFDRMNPSISPVTDLVRSKRNGKLNLLNRETQVLIEPACFTRLCHLFQFINTTLGCDRNLFKRKHKC